MQTWVNERWTAGRKGSGEIVGQFIVTHTVAAITLIISLLIGSLLHWRIGGVEWHPFTNWLYVDNITQAVWQAGWPLFLLAMFWGFIASLRTRFFYSRYDLTSLGIGSKFYISLMAGIWEELGYRSVFIFTGMISAVILNKITFGLYLWLFQHITIPVINFFTWWKMADVWSNAPLLLAAGMLSAAFSFRDGHEYQGEIGKWHSFYIGLYLLSVTLNYGLLIAMILHFLYDFILLMTEHVIHDVTT